MHAFNTYIDVHLISLNKVTDQYVVKTFIRVDAQSNNFVRYWSVIAMPGEHRTENVSINFENATKLQMNIGNNNTCCFIWQRVLESSWILGVK